MREEKLTVPGTATDQAKAKAMKPSLLAATGLALGVLALGGCSNVQSSLGLDRSGPDEFEVITQAPLVMPPDFRLNAPQPGAPRPTSVTPQGAAQQAILGTTGTGEPATPSNAESILIQRAGAEQADPTIRESLNEDTTTARPASGVLTETILRIRGQSPEQEGVLDAQEEAERLRREGEAERVTGPTTPPAAE